MRDFQPSEQYFNSVRQSFIRSLNNHNLAEPYQLGETYKSELLETNQYDTEKLLKATNDMTFKQFTALKSRWLENLHPEWLIQGHLTGSEALELVDIAEEALSFDRITEDEVELRRCVKLEPRSVYSFEKKNKLDTNPNSCIIVTFSANCLHNQRDIHTRLLVLHGLIKEIFFDQLRT